MKLTKKSGATIAMTAATLLVAGTLATASMATEINGRCFGVNACKGQGQCKSAHNACKGQNTCKGKGWLAMTKGECDNQGGQFENG
jgi:hypothetical protein